jgi:hypothetical protein
MDMIKFRCHRLVKHQDGSLTLWRLPVEILHQIFVYCLPDTATGRSHIVYRRWWKIVVDMPSLWCRLHTVVLQLMGHNIQ